MHHQHISVRKPLMGALGAGILYDLAEANFGRRTAQLMGARTTAAIWVTDYLIDDFQVTHARKIDILNTMLNSLRTGQVYEFRDLPQLNAISKLFSRMWLSLEDAPNRSLFEEGFAQLRDAAERQIRGDCSIELSIDVGSKSLTLMSRAVSAWDIAACRIEPAVSLMGGFLQLFDDLYDIEHDRRHGIRTFATEAQCCETAIELALPKARVLLKSAYDSLPCCDHWALDAIYFGALHSTNQLRAFRNIIPSRPNSSGINHIEGGREKREQH